MKLCPSCQHVFNVTIWDCPVCQFSPNQLMNFLAFAPDLADKNIGFKQQDFAKYAELEEKNFWFYSRIQLINWAIKTYFPSVTSFLEVGCGAGNVLTGITQAFPSLKLFGSDLANTALEYASRKIPEATFFQMDARQIPFVDEFNVIGAFDILEHILEDELVLHQMYQAIKPGGGIILTVPQHQFLWSEHDEHLCHIRRYNKKELTTKVKQAGFEIIRISSFVSLLFPCMLMARIFQRFSKKPYDCLTELQLPVILNTLFANILTIERKLIQLGCNFPFGGSLLVVAMKN